MLPLTPMNLVPSLWQGQRICRLLVNPSDLLVIYCQSLLQRLHQRLHHQFNYLTSGRYHLLVVLHLLRQWKPADYLPLIHSPNLEFVATEAYIMFCQSIRLFVADGYTPEASTRPHNAKQNTVQVTATGAPYQMTAIGRMIAGRTR